VVGKDHAKPTISKTKTARGLYLIIMLLFVLLGVAIFNMKIINSKIRRHRYPEISLANSITAKSLDIPSVMPSYSVRQYRRVSGQGRQAGQEPG
jgi:methyl-accepting chemotaxis protein